MPIAGALIREVESLRRNWFWFFLLGVLLVILGLVALGCSVTTTIVSVIFIGWFLLIGGIMEIIHAFWARAWSGFLIELSIGVLQVVVGGLMTANPVEFAAALTLLMAVFFTVSGAFRMIAAIAHHIDGRGWLFLSGLINFILGIMIWRRWPGDAIWIIGMFVGIDLVFQGWWLVMLAISAKSAPKLSPQQ